jgi:hypothetical protein
MAKTKAPINATDNLPQTRSALRGLASLREIDCTDQADVLLSRQRSNKKPMNTAILTRINHSAIISIMLNFRRMNMLGKLLSTIAPLILTAATGGAAAPLVMAQQAAMRAVVQMAIQKLGQELGLPPALINMAQMAASGQMGGAAGAGDFNAIGSGQNFQNQLMSQFSPAAQGVISRAFDAFQSASNGLGDSLSRAEQTRNNAVDAYESAVASGASDRELRPLEQAMDKANSEVRGIDKLISDLQLTDHRKQTEKDLKQVMGGKGSLLMKIAIILGTVADQKMKDMASKADQIGKFGEVKGKNQAQYTKLTSEMQALGQEMNIVSQAASNVLKSIGEAASTLARKG